jgi:hypothetical protein
MAHWQSHLLWSLLGGSIASILHRWLECALVLIPVILDLLWVFIRTLMLLHVLLHGTVAETSITSNAQRLGIKLRLKIKLVVFGVTVYLSKLILMLVVLLSISIHEFRPGHLSISHGTLVHVTAPWVDLWREKWLYLLLNSLNIIFFLAIKQKFFPSEAKIKKLFVDQVDLPVG